MDDNRVSPMEERTLTNAIERAATVASINTDLDRNVLLANQLKKACVDPKFAKDPQAYMDFLKTLAADEASFHGERIAEYHVKEDGGHKIGLKERRILARKKYAQRVAFDVLVPFGFAYDAVATGADYQYVKEQLLKYGTFLLLRKYIWAFLGVELSEETTEEILHMNGRIY